MRVCMTPIRGLSITVLMVASLFMAAACAEEPTATPAPAPTATATPAPTPTPTPTPSAADYLAAAGANIGAMQTAKFSMVDETGTGALFFGATFKSMEAVLKAPDGLRMLVDVVAPGFGFLEIEMIKVGDQAFVKLSKNARWSPLPRGASALQLCRVGYGFCQFACYGTERSHDRPGDRAGRPDLFALKEWLRLRLCWTSLRRRIRVMR